MANKVIQWIEDNKLISAAIIFILLNALIIPQQEIDKKEAKSPLINIPGIGNIPASNVVVTGALSATPWLVRVIPGWGWVVGGVLLLGPFIIDKFTDIFQPEPTIPPWIYIGAFIILALLVLRSGKKKGG